MHSELSVFARRQPASLAQADLACTGLGEEHEIDFTGFRSRIGRFLYRLRLSTSQKGEPKIQRPSASRLVGIAIAIIATAVIAGQLYGESGSTIDSFGQSVLVPTRSPQGLPAAGAGCEPILYGDVNIDGAVELDDILCTLTGFSGSFVDCPLEFVDIMPCGGGDDVVDLDDILAVLGAIAGDPSCDQACLPCVDNVPPNASAVPDLDVDVGEVVNFSASGSTDSDGLLVVYEWDWGDGTSARGEEVTHVFLTAGIFAVTLAVTDSCNASAIETATVTVREVSNNSLIADAGPDQTVIEGDEALFNASLSRAATAEVVSYDWDFGDCVVGKGALDTHTYSDPGTYTVTLTVTDADGNVATDTTEVTVNPSLITSANFAVYELIAANQPGEGQCEKVWREIDLENEEIELGLRVRFEPTISTGGIFHSLQFMDGSTVTYSQAPDAGDLERLVHAYDEPGVYNVRLRVWDAEGNVEIAEKAVTVAEGMEVLDVLPSASRDATNLAIDGSIGWVTRSWGELAIVDISDPGNLELLDVVSAPAALGIAAAGGRVYLGSASNGLHIYEVNYEGAVPEPMLRATYDTNAEDGQFVRDVVAEGNVVYFTAGAPGLKILDTSNPWSPQLLGSVRLPGDATAWLLKVSDGTAFVSDTSGYLHVIDVSGIDIWNPVRSAPVLLKTLEVGDKVNGMAVSLSGVLASVSDGGIDLFDASDPAFTAHVYNIDIQTEAGRLPHDIVIAGTSLYMGFSPRPGGFPFEVLRLNVLDPSAPYTMESLQRDGGWLAGIIRNPVFHNGTLYWRNSAHDILTVRVPGG